MLDLIEREGFWVREKFAEADLVVVRDIGRDDAYKLSLIIDYLDRANNLIIDVGAHIGVFAKTVHRFAPEAKIICVEADPLNIPALTRNVGDFAEVIHGVVTYDRRPLTFLSTVAKEDCRNTGGGMLAPASQAVVGEYVHREYEAIKCPRRFTLEEISGGDAYIDLLKLDCEGAEFSILSNCDLSTIGFIVGEYHGAQAWNYLRDWRLGDWDYGHMSASGDMGNFHLRSPRL
jgi:FkbM family methyltransferase